MNNLHYSNNIYDLIEIIIEEQLGKQVSSLSIALLNNGPSTIIELQKLISLEYLEVRNALIILMQNKLVFFQEVTRKDVIETVYELDVDSVLNYLRFPKILYFINHHHDYHAMLIFEEFMQLGILSAGQVIEQVTEKLNQLGKANPSTINNVKIKFIQLIEGGFVSQCTQKKSNEIREELSKSKKEDKKVSNKKKKKISESDEILVQRSGNNINKSIVSNVIEDDNPLIFDKEKNKYYYFCLNFDKIITELKCEIVVDLINQRMGGQAGMIGSILLRKNPGNAFKEGKTFPITIEEIIKNMGFVSKDKKTLLEKQESVKNIIEDMSRVENDFVLTWGITEAGQTYCLNLESIANILKNKTLEKIIEQEFSLDHLRIYRLLAKCGPLDAKNIMEICLMPHKECSACLNQMIQEGFVEIQQLNLKGSNIIFYNINSKSNIELMIAKIYKIIKNLKFFLKTAIEKIKNTESITKQEEYINKVYATISELDDTIIVLKYF
jgi:hypothetical protein